VTERNANRAPSTAPVRGKLLWLIGGRAAVVTVLLGSAILIQIKSPGSMPGDPFFLLIGLTYALTAIWALTLKYVPRIPWLVDVQLACDALIVSVIVYLTGGVTSYFSSLYTLPIIAASMVHSWRGGLMVGVLSSVIYSGLVLGQYSDGSAIAMIRAADLLPPPRVAMYTVGLNVFGFMGVATLSGYLAEGLRRTGAQLEQASSQLADLQAFSQHVIDSLTSGLATTDTAGRVLTFNRAAETITGLPASAAVGRLAADVLQLPPTFGSAAAAEAARTGLPRIEFGFTRQDGRQIELGSSLAPLFTPRGQSGILFTFQDITEAKKLEREARVQQRLAAVGEMAAGIAHEIRNPLASMAGSIQILRQELPLTPEQSQLMDIVLRESERLNETIGSFLAYARPQRASMLEIDVRRILTDAAALLENSAELTSAHKIVADVPPDPLIFRADEAQIRQIVWNLATNGLRAMPNGGRLRLAASQQTGADGQPERLVISVSDEGVGIAPEQMDGIFQPFRSAFARGTGLGLSIVHRIVSDYGGEVRVSSQPGRGTSVDVVLPLAAAPVASMST
jgi:two-component system, NtrC family, sensor histidine kinase PilS